ncbi:PUA-like domain-containing protein [Cercophora newfieldiana]|uniref:PUA-like domain-containing protein n=1 Tax=Cercophora newfieldiana TaxID=92897 RepID=A0AA39YDS4_9PEZI|nr:PUA-like domain-containing protein [Cercophora newfieldiana]
MNRRRAAVRAYLFYLEHEVKISPELQAKKVDVALTWITFPREPVDYPKDIVEQAGRVYTKFQEESWGVDADPEEAESDEEVAPDAALPVTRSARTIRADSVRTSAAILPPPSHHIWGIRGIMHGLARKVNKRGGYSYIFDKRYISKKKDFWVIGNNGLTPGAWWPLQRLALFHGAHGSAGGGISGSPIHGCYSIVVSGRSVYHDMDEDRGETLFYSADNSVHNTNRNAVDTITNRTRSLQVSHREGRPVRVLRSQGGTRAYAPKVGIRYDGLYRVVKQLERTNRSGGRYLQFKLQRLEEQRPFAETVAAAPTAQQQRDFHESRREYH